jgi:hypothetical protein
MRESEGPMLPDRDEHWMEQNENAKERYENQLKADKAEISKEFKSRERVSPLQKMLQERDRLVREEGPNFVGSPEYEELKKKYSPKRKRR